MKNMSDTESFKKETKDSSQNQEEKKENFYTKGSEVEKVL